MRHELRAAAILAIAVITFALTACGMTKKNELRGESAVPIAGGHGLAAAEASVDEQFADISRNDRGSEWELMHPADQAVVSKERWISCNAVRHLKLRVKVIGSRYVRARIAGVGETPAWQLRIDITGNVEETVESVFRVDVGGRWRWVLDDRGVAHVKSGQCP